MKLFDSDPTLRWLFCLTHPDDELAIAGWIHRLASAGVEVHLSWTTADAERAGEAAQAARLLGVPAERLHFHAGQDRRIESQIGELMPSFVSMIENVSPDRIGVGAFEQGHLDHDATNYLVAQSVARASCPRLESRGQDGLGTRGQDARATASAVILEIPLYHAYCQPIPLMNRFATPSEEEALLLTADDYELKKRAARSYTSQNIWGNALLYRFLQILRGEKEPIGTVERMRRQTHFDYRVPNLPPRLAARVQKTSRWAKWIRALDGFEDVAPYQNPYAR